MMVPDENSPLFHGQMPSPFPDSAVFIDVAFELGLSVRVSASIHRIGQNLVEGVVGGQRLRKVSFGWRQSADSEQVEAFGEVVES
jgi:hypothetical protein